MNVQIWVVGSSLGSKTLINVRLDKGDTVGNLKSKIAEAIRSRDATASNNVRVRLIFAGSEVENENVALTTLELGVGTTIHAIICETVEQSPKIETEDLAVIREPATRNTWKPEFYVFCKGKCNSMTQGKLRVRCSQCKYQGSLCSREPSSWDDVLHHNRIPGKCLTNSCADSFSEFYFKCSKCAGEPSVVALPHVKNNVDAIQCAICTEVKNPLVTFACNRAHSICLNCFKLEASMKLDDRNFVVHPTFGYTLTCPAGCRTYITDPHHFRILGDEQYDKYQRITAEMFVLNEGGTFCPNVQCGAGFLIPASSESRAPATEMRANSGAKMNLLLLCPECKMVFCKFCKLRASECCCDTLNDFHNTVVAAGFDDMAMEEFGGSNVKSLVTVQMISKRCPKCDAPTVKDGGCNHITCGVCRFPWCWICMEVWKDDCQADHWFE